MCYGIIVINLGERKDILLFLSQIKYCLRSSLPRLVKFSLVISAILELISSRKTGWGPIPQAGSLPLWLTLCWPMLPCSGSSLFWRFHSFYPSLTIKIPWRVQVRRVSAWTPQAPQQLSPGGIATLEMMSHDQVHRISNLLLQPQSFMVPMPLIPIPTQEAQGLHILLGDPST